MPDHPPDPHVGLGVDHHDEVEAALLPCFNEEGDVLDHDGAGGGFGDHRGGPLPDQGVDNAVQLSPALRVAEDDGPEARPVQPPRGVEDLLPEGPHHGSQPGRAGLDDFTRYRVSIHEHRAQLLQAYRHH
ncbi:MAG: hypothetical protein K0S72_2266 [Arthrobacter sp.]|nr:hypothetical protein [Arthrobacter sp.]